LLRWYLENDWSEKRAVEPSQLLATRRFQAWTDYSIEKSPFSGSKNINTASFHGKIKPVFQQTNS
jgi:hypothetical protein